MKQAGHVRAQAPHAEAPDAPELPHRREGAPPRVVIEGVRPEIECGRFPAKRIVGDRMTVTAVIYADGHDVLAGRLLFRRESATSWEESRLEKTEAGLDLWRGELALPVLEPHRYTVEAWVDRFATWRRGLQKKIEAGQDVRLELASGAQLIEEAASRAAEPDAGRLREAARALKAPGARPAAGLDEDLARLMDRYPDRRSAARYSKELAVTVDRPLARFSAWYEMFPRSTSTSPSPPRFAKTSEVTSAVTSEGPGRHGTLEDCARRLPYVAEMGFDVLYLPPIHPIGRSHRKGRNNNPSAEPGDPGSPWAIGAAEGGHTAIHPDLGSLQDFRMLLARARELGIEVAMDLAFQCAPDHPYVKEHPEWFRRRPDGSVQYAENPPKKYEDIYPLDFESPSWKELWEELKRVVLFWIEQGVRVFRVDNPHTKPFRFWEWLIAEVKREHPETMFLSEAFTRPAVMYHLAKLGFTQSYTYFAWRNTKEELTRYFTEMAASGVREYFRPNLWPNTPDILPEHLQFGGRAAFMSRLVLAATLGASYGIYGPVFELCEGRARTPGTEEYLDSEKYEVRSWDLDSPDSLRHFIARVNRIRRESPALQSDERLRFHSVDNDQLIAYSKSTEVEGELILTVVNLDPHHAHSGWLELPVEELGIASSEAYQLHDLLGGSRHLWCGRRNYVELDPRVVPAHIFRLRRKVRSERDFDYFL